MRLLWTWCLSVFQISQLSLLICQKCCYNFVLSPELPFQALQHACSQNSGMFLTFVWKGFLDIQYRGSATMCASQLGNIFYAEDPSGNQFTFSGQNSSVRATLWCRCGETKVNTQMVNTGISTNLARGNQREFSEVPLAGMKPYILGALPTCHPCTLLPPCPTRHLHKEWLSSSRQH